MHPHDIGRTSGWIEEARATKAWRALNWRGLVITFPTPELRVTAACETENNNPTPNPTPNQP